MAKYSKKIGRTRTPPILRPPSAIEAYRPVLKTDDVASTFDMLQTFVELFLEERQLEVGERIALDSLRVQLYPPQPLTLIQKRLPDIRNTGHVATRMRQRLAAEQSQADLPLSQVTASLGTLLRINEISYATLLFRDSRLQSEQRHLYDSVGDTYRGKNDPQLPLCTVPELDRLTAGEINLSLSELAPMITLPLEPIRFELHGPTK